MKDQAPGQGPEPGGIAEAGQDLRPVDDADAGHGRHDPCGVGVAEQGSELGVEVADLEAERQGQACLCGDVLGQVGVAELAVPQLQGLGGGGQQAAGVLIAPGAVGVAPDEPGEPGPAQPPQGVRVGVAGARNRSGVLLPRSPPNAACQAGPSSSR